MSKSNQPCPRSTLLSERLAHLAPLTSSEIASLRAAECDGRRLPARQELVREGKPIRERRGLLSGWAISQRILVEGPRQILSFLVPGDLIGNCQHTAALAATTTLALTEVVTCGTPMAQSGTALAEAYARSAALEHHYLLAQITRLGRLNAYERIVDWLLETCDRLAVVGLGTADQFALPLTQELLADTLGLTSVHVNRTLQSLRRDGLLRSRAGVFSFPDRQRLEKLVNYKAARVSSPT